jgi:UDP:flavonoid glycosyltransferase YjiC (YdhE family)
MTWELGLGMGHVARLEPVARRLAERGHKVCVSARNTEACANKLEDSGVEVIATPCRIIPRGLIATPLTHTHTLYNCGFSNAAGLELGVRSWLSLFQRLRVDVLVADHSPVALLAAALVDLRTLAIGTGFEIPPNVSPAPNLRPELVDEDRSIVAGEERVLENINTVARQLMAPSLQSVSSFYHCTPPLLLTYKELDPYWSRANGLYHGTLRPDWGTRPNWPLASGPRVFAYLIEHEFSFEMIDVLSRCTCPVLVIGDANVIERYPTIRNSAACIQSKQVNARQVAEECDLSICFGQHGSIVSALRAGKPLVLTPLTLEQRLHSERVAGIGAGVIASIGDGADFESRLLELIADEGLRRVTSNAQQFSAKYADSTDDSILRRVVDHIEKAAT